MAHYLLWIDHEHAKVFRYTPAGTEKQEMKNHHHHAHHTNHTDHEKKNNFQKFYHEVAEKLNDATELLIVGPGMAKNEFKSHLESHYHEKIYKKVIGIEAMDKGTDGEIQNLAKKYYHKYNLFNP